MLNAVLNLIKNDVHYFHMVIYYFDKSFSVTIEKEVN